MDPLNSLGTLYTAHQLSYCQNLPKIELHAHLNGSIRDATIRELAVKKDLDPGLVSQTGHRSLADCFKIFDIIHQVATDLETISRIAFEVVEDFAQDNVVYLELRTTPKNRPEHNLTKLNYVEAVLRGLQKYQQHANHTQDAKQILVKLLLSIDRRESAESAMETVAIAASLKGQGVVGIDLSGNPTLGSWDSWEPALLKARKLGLKLTVHTGEVYKPEETRAVLAMKPERLGHMCFLDKGLEKALRRSRIPVELCLSSNVITQSVSGYPDHHFLPLFTAGHPVILCTDDSGVFGTSLSREYAIAASAFHLDGTALLTLAEAAVDHCFLDAADKEQLRSRFEGFRMRNARMGSPVLGSGPLEPLGSQES